MNWDSLIINAAGVSWVSALAAGTYCVLGSSLFDIKQSAADKKSAKHPSSRCFKKKPLISVIVLSENNQSTVIECIRSIWQSGYRKYEVLIVDNDSRDETKRVVKQFIKSNKRKNLKLLTIKSSSANQTLKVCLSQSKGDLIVFADANSVFDKNSLKRAVNYMQAKQAKRWAANLRPISNQNMVSFAKSINYTVFGQPLKKLHSFKSSTSIELGILYDKEEVKSNVFALKTPTAASIKLLTCFKGGILSIIKVSWLILFAYLSYIAISHNYALPLGLFLFSVFTYSGITISSDSATSFKAKAGTILTLPGGLILLYFTLVVGAAKKASALIAETIFFHRALKKT